MPISTATIASTVALILTATGPCITVFAQEVPQDCGNCVLAAALGASPTCNAVNLGTTNEPNAMTPIEKACFCPLASSDAWIQTCVKPGACSAVDIGVLEPQFVADKDIVCAGVTNPPSDGGITSTGVQYFQLQVLL